MTWQKGNITTGNHVRPYRICSERILVFSRKGETVIKNQNGMPVSDILNYPTETFHATTRMNFGKIPFGDYHIFQKPQKLMEFLIKQHTYPGDLVCEPFSCSGSGAIASIKLNRKWVYIESNKNNYIWGKKRIQKALKEQSVGVG